MRVIAVDPGYERLGVAVVERAGGREVVLHSDCLITPKIALPLRLRMLGEKFEALITAWSPEYFATEKLFFESNQKTSLGVAEAKGMLSYLAAKHGLASAEFTPLQVKMAVTSYGRADKQQVILMLHRLVSIEKKIAHDDEYDAIAVGLTCLATMRHPAGE